MPRNQSPPSVQPPPRLAGVVERNIEALIARRKLEQGERPVQEKIADRITRFTGSMTFVYVHIAFFGIWVLMNLGWIPGPKFDPSFVVLAMFASVEAIFLSTFVLISQNRMAALSDKRAELDLQVSLLAEHEITRLLMLLREVASKLGVQALDENELGELAQDIAPEKVLDRMADHERSAIKATKE
jgi:uncharacterized membrane protein